MSKGRHARPNNTTISRKVALSATVTLGAAVVPATFASSAHAAPSDAWERIAACESGDMNIFGSAQWNRPDGHASSTGGLQIQLPTWNDFGGQEYAAAPYLATRAQQIAIGERILAGQGAGAWVCNNPGHGIASGALNGHPGDANAKADAPAPAPVPDPAEEPPAPPGAEPPDAEDGAYVVKPGDYLAKIARTLGTDGGWERLYEINKEAIGANPHLIRPGLKLRLPGHEAPASGLPKVNQSDPSAVELQDELKRTGYMADSVKSDANYGPRTQASVIKFHEGHPEYRDGNDRQIGPKGWAHLKAMKAKASPPADNPTAKAALPLQGRIGDGLIVNGSCISRGCGGHSGLDISARQGTPVLAAAAGTVVSVNGSAGAAYGNYVAVKHSGGVYTLYAHLSTTSVSVGQSVAAGDQVGNVGSTGNSSGPHLHFEVRTSPDQFNVGVFLDPVTWLRNNGVSL